MEGINCGFYADNAPTRRRGPWPTHFCRSFLKKDDPKKLKTTVQNKGQSESLRSSAKFITF